MCGDFGAVLKSDKIQTINKTIAIHFTSQTNIREMAKGLRSKSMRKNRTYLRETLVKPLIRERQEKIAEAMKKKIEEQNSSTLLQLKKIIPTGSNEEAEDIQNIVEPSKNRNIEEDDDENMNVNDDEESSEDDAEATSKFVKKNGKQNNKFGNKKQVIKSSRQSTKEMFWFK